MKALQGKVALVAGATRGAGRGIAIELAEAGAITYVTGRSTKAARSPMNRAETIEETAELISARGGRAVAVRVDHTVAKEVAALVARIHEEQAGRLDILVNDVWGGDPLTQWGAPFWEHDLDAGLLMQRAAVHSHLITSWHVAPLMTRRRTGLIVEVTDGILDRYRGSLFYDLAKAAVIRLALSQAEDLRSYDVAAVALSPGFLRSEAMLDHFGVTESTWRDALLCRPRSRGPGRRSKHHGAQRQGTRHLELGPRIRVLRRGWHSAGLGEPRPRSLGHGYGLAARPQQIRMYRLDNLTIRAPCAILGGRTRTGDASRENIRERVLVSK